MAGFCRHCGSRLDDGSLFCGSCGARVEKAAASGRQAPGAPRPVPQTPVKKKKKAGAVVAIVLSAAVLFSFLFTAFVAPGFLPAFLTGVSTVSAAFFLGILLTSIFYLRGNCIVSKNVLFVHRTAPGYIFHMPFCFI